MFFLNAQTLNGSIILHIRGHATRNGFGLVDGEGIFEVKRVNDPENPNKLSMAVTGQVGTVEFVNGKPFFNYTDDFKKSINYNENGYSTMDGGVWTIHATSYLDSEGKTQNQLNPRMAMQFMYCSASNPFLPLGFLFSNTMFSKSKMPAQALQTDAKNTAALAK